MVSVSMNGNREVFTVYSGLTTEAFAARASAKKGTVAYSTEVATNLSKQIVEMQGFTVNTAFFETIPTIAAAVFSAAKKRFKDSGDSAAVFTKATIIKATRLIYSGEDQEQHVNKINELTEAAISTVRSLKSAVPQAAHPAARRPAAAAPVQPALSSVAETLAGEAAVAPAVAPATQDPVVQIFNANAETIVNAVQSIADVGANPLNIATLVMTIFNLVGVVPSIDTPEEGSEVMNGIALLALAKVYREGGTLDGAIKDRKQLEYALFVQLIPPAILTLTQGAAVAQSCWKARCASKS